MGFIASRLHPHASFHVPPRGQSCGSESCQTQDVGFRHMAPPFDVPVLAIQKVSRAISEQKHILARSKRKDLTGRVFKVKIVPLHQFPLNQTPPLHKHLPERGSRKGVLAISGAFQRGVPERVF